MRFHSVFILCLLTLVPHRNGTAAGLSTAAQEQQECRPGELSTWNDGADRPALGSSFVFVYDGSQAPPWFPHTEVLHQITNAATAWSQCGIPARVVPVGSAEAHGKRVIVRWSDEESRGNFGLANLGRATLSLGPKAFAMLRERNPRHDARLTLQMVISHEMGHLFGLMAHSRRCVDTMSYYTDGKGGLCFTRQGSYIGAWGELRSLMPTACDIERCRKANGMQPLPGSKRPNYAPAG